MYRSLNLKITIKNGQKCNFCLIQGQNEFILNISNFFTSEIGQNLTLPNHRVRISNFFIIEEALISLLAYFDSIRILN